MFHLFVVCSALKALSERKDIVHRDISYTNILVLEVDVVGQEAANEGPVEVIHPGLLIDFEYAAHLSDAYAMLPGRCTIRVPFPPFHSAFLMHLAGYITIHGN